MIWKLFDAEREKLKDYNYPGGGLDPPYGPTLDHVSHWYAYHDLLKNEWQRLLFESLEDPL